MSTGASDAGQDGVLENGTDTAIKAKGEAWAVNDRKGAGSFERHLVLARASRSYGTQAQEWVSEGDMGGLI